MLVLGADTAHLRGVTVGARGDLNSRRHLAAHLHGSAALLRFDCLGPFGEKIIAFRRILFVDFYILFEPFHGVQHVFLYLVHQSCVLLARFDIIHCGKAIRTGRETDSLGATCFHTLLYSLGIRSEYIVLVQLDSFHRDILPKSLVHRLQIFNHLHRLDDLRRFTQLCNCLLPLWNDLWV